MDVDVSGWMCMVRCVCVGGCVSETIDVSLLPNVENFEELMVEI